jgi:hypothetical protein
MLFIVVTVAAVMLMEIDPALALIGTARLGLTVDSLPLGFRAEAVVTRGNER